MRLDSGKAVAFDPSLVENIKEKFDLVLEGHAGIHHEIKDMRQEMNERFELVDFKIDALNQKIDGVDKKLSNKIDAVGKSLKQEIRTVADDLSAHRTDTESHRKGYKVSDG